MYVKLDQSIVIVGEGAWAGLLMLMYFSIQPGLSVAEEVARIAHCTVGDYGVIVDLSYISIFYLLAPVLLPSTHFTICTLQFAHIRFGFIFYPILM